MAPTINNVNSEDLRLRYAQMATIRNAEQTGVNGATSQINATRGIQASTNTQSIEPKNLDASRITQLAQKYATGSTKINPSVEAAAATTAAPVAQPQSTTELSRITTNDALAQRAAYNVATPTAVVLNARLAASPYQSTINSYSNMNMEMYNQLAKAKLA